MSASAEIIERIKKLLRLARSSNPHEAELALSRAMELAREHNIAIDSLNPDEAAKQREITHSNTEVESRISYDKRYAWAICRACFNVDTVTIRCIRIVDGWQRYGYKTAIVGTRNDIEIAQYVFGFLTAHFSYCWRKHRGRLRNRHAFVHGMYRGLFTKLCERMPTDGSAEAKGMELSIDVRRGYIAKYIGETTTSEMGEPDHDAHAAAMAGYQHGLNTNINPALKPTTPSPLALC